MNDTRKIPHTMRYRTLYYLLPVFNGVAIEAGYHILQRITDNSLPGSELPAGFASFLIGSAYFAAALVIPGLIICSLEIFFLGRIYRQRTFPFVLRTLRSRKTSNETAIQFVAPLLLTFAGGISVVLALRMFSMAAPDRGGMSSTLIILATVFMYVLTVMPVLVRCECDRARRTGGSPGGPA